MLLIFEDRSEKLRTCAPFFWIPASFGAKELSGRLEALDATPGAAWANSGGAANNTITANKTVANLEEYIINDKFNKLHINYNNLFVVIFLRLWRLKVKSHKGP